MPNTKSKSAPRSGARNTINTLTVIDLNVLAEKVAAILSRRNEKLDQNEPAKSTIEECVPHEEGCEWFNKIRDSLKEEEARA